jgi:hypothetical protein
MRVLGTPKNSFRQNLNFYLFVYLDVKVLYTVRVEADKGPYYKPYLIIPNQTGFFSQAAN